MLVVVEGASRRALGRRVEQRGFEVAEGRTVLRLGEQHLAG